MKIYLVGGAVRDELLGIPFKEKDWLVVNSSHEEMLEKGFKQVGKHFPVYLHPKSKEEYALARKETKIGKGHKKFKFDTNLKISLKEDLKRRDITINAIAKDESGKLYDPYGGIKDIKSKKIRIVSKAFFEDPLRIFRVARFKTKLSELSFSLTEETIKTLKEMSDNEEVNYLSGERIWDETKKALSYKNSSNYFKTLKKINALQYFDGLENVYKENIKFLEILDNSENRISEKWAIINLNSNLAKDLEQKIKIPNKISNFRKTFNKMYLFQENGNISKKELLTDLNKINFFRDETLVIESFLLLKELKIISSKELKAWKQMLFELKNVKINVENLKPDEIKSMLFEKRLKTISLFEYVK